jgi:hypothetical protein
MVKGVPAVFSDAALGDGEEGDEKGDSESQ